MGHNVRAAALPQPDRSARQGQAVRRPAGRLSVSDRRLDQRDRDLQADADHQRDEPGDARLWRSERREQCRRLRPDPRRHPDRAHLLLDRQQRDEMGAAAQRRADRLVLRAVSGAVSRCS